MKNKNISKRLFILMLTITATFSLMLLIANSLLLKPLYYSSVKKTMIEAIEELSDINYEEDTSVWNEAVRAIQSGKYLDITIESSGDIIYSSSMDVGLKSGPDNRDNEPQQPNQDKRERKPKEPFYNKMPENEWQALSETIVFGTMIEPDHKTELFVFKGQVNENITVYIIQSVAPIVQSVRQANLLLIAVSLLFMIITAFVASRLSLSFTKPIRMMQTYVGQLSKLQFESNCEVTTGDELQNLNEDIKVLATELEYALNELKNKNLQLEREIKAQRMLVSNVSHELRTPLSLIKGYADEISAGFISNREQEQKYVGYIAEESAKMKRLLNEILELSKLESGRMTYEPQVFRIDEAIVEFLDKYEGFIEENSLNITFETLPCEGFYDRICFEQILANYISNAAKYCDDRKVVKVSYREIGNVIRIEVFNTGDNISDDVIDYLWDDFYKADKSRTGDNGSYGLGLSIVKAIQDKAGQAYGVENVDEGIVFWFEVEK